MSVGRISRDRLYELVWQQPMQHLAKEVGISDVAVAKHCRKAGIPLPPRGYWAKLQAGKPVRRTPLPARELGEDIYLSLAGHMSRLSRETVDEEMQDGPYEDLEAMTARFRKRLGKAAVPRDFSKAHREIRKLLDKDEMHRQKKLSEQYYWYDPVFDTPFERRRLRILNALFVTAARLGGQCWVRGEKAREHSITIGDYSLGFTLDRDETRSGRRAASKRDPDRLRLALTFYQPPAGVRTSWEDEEGSTIEQRFADIFVELAMAAEQLQRAWVTRNIAWQQQRRQEAEEQARKAREEADRIERERLAAIAKAKLDALHADAAALQQAAHIRMYADQVAAALSGQLPAGQLESWVAWARNEADRLDPFKSGRAVQSVEGHFMENADKSSDAGT